MLVYCAVIHVVTRAAGEAKLPALRVAGCGLLSAAIAWQAIHIALVYQHLVTGLVEPVAAQHSQHG